MMYPYAEFLLDFDRRHGRLTHSNTPENSRAAVIVETRPLYFLPMVIRDAMFFLGAGWNLHVVCGEYSANFVRSTLVGWDVGISKLPNVYRLSTRDYTALLTSPAFWQAFREERILIFQSDSLLTASGIEDFSRFDYVGAPCRRLDEHYMVNGGLSLRSRKLMLECLAKFRLSEGEPEDVFFTRAVRAIGAPMPDFATATRFAVESIYTVHPIGVHGTDKSYHPVEVAQKIVSGIHY